MTKRPKLAALALGAALIGVTGGAAALEGRAINGPWQSITFPDTGVTPVGATLSATLWTTGTTNNVSTTRSIGSGSHKVDFIWGCSGTTMVPPLSGTFTTSGLKFSRTCPFGTTAGPAAAYIDDL
jgi:hypothetical protein